MAHSKAMSHFILMPPNILRQSMFQESLTILQTNTLSNSLSAQTEKFH